MYFYESLKVDIKAESTPVCLVRKAAQLGFGNATKLVVEKEERREKSVVQRASSRAVVVDNFVVEKNYNFNEVDYFN